MNLYICDRCCKQMTRFVSENQGRYEIGRKEQGEHAGWLMKLKLCDECQAHVDDLLDTDFRRAFKSQVTLDTGVDWR